MPPFYRFMLITKKNNTPTSEYLDFIKQCADGGITSLQLREKNLSFKELMSFSEVLLPILESYKIPLVINDFPELAQRLHTSYIHLGQNDATISHTYNLIPNAQIGVSIEDINHLTKTNIQNLSYITASAVFASNNKSNLRKIWGLKGLKTLSQQSVHPVTAIGGITLENTEDIITHGAQGIALIGALHDTISPYNIAKSFRDKLDYILKS